MKAVISDRIYLEVLPHQQQKIDKELNDKHKSKSKIGEVRIWAAVTPPTIKLLRGQTSVQ